MDASDRRRDLLDARQQQHAVGGGDHHSDGGWPSSSNQPRLPTRSSTVGSPDELGRDSNSKQGQHEVRQHARSEDLNHSQAFNSSPGGSPLPGFQSLSRPLTPNDYPRTGASSSNHSDFDEPTNTKMRRLSTASSSIAAPMSAVSKAGSVSSPIPASATCGACSLPLEGSFVRALGNVWHLQCFKCKVRPMAHLSNLSVLTIQ